MATNVTLKRVNATSGSTDDLHPTTDWSQIESKPSTFAPTSHDSDHDTHNDARYAAIDDVGTVGALDLNNSTTQFLRGDGTFATPAGTTFNGGTITGDLAIENAGPNLTLKDTTDSDDIALYFKNSSNSTVGQFTTAGNRLNIITNFSNGLSIDAVKVGIGTTSPAQKLDVAGTAHIGKIDIGAGTFQNRINANGDQALVINSNGSVLSLNADVSDNLILVNGGGNVGIGTTSPGRQLELNGEGVMRLDSASGDPGIDFQTAGTQDMQFRYRATSDYLGIYSYGTTSDVMAIRKSDGYVGIGTTSPDYNLNVEGSSGIGIGQSSSTHDLVLSNRANYANDTSNSHIWVSSGSTGAFSGEGAHMVLETRQSARNIYFKVGNVTAPQHIMDYNGKVGIGTTSPTEKLTVVGDSTTSENSPVAYIKHNFTGTHGFGLSISRDNSDIAALALGSNSSNHGIVVGNNTNLVLGTISSGVINDVINVKTDSSVDVDGNIKIAGDNRYMTFGTPGAGTTTGARFFSIEGNTDTSGEGSGRIFFTEHNSSTTHMDNYGMSLGYRGGASSIEGASGNTWSGLSQISNGQWGMWGHNNSAAGALVMSGDRAATFIDFHSNELRNVNIANARYFDTYQRDTIDSASEDFNDFTTSGIYTVNNWNQSGDVVQNGPTNTAAGNAYGWGMLRVTNFQSTTGTGNGYVVQEYIPHISDTHYIRFQWNGTWTSWRAAWGSDNDGAGSGVDADLLDGQHGSYYTGYTDTAISNLIASAPGTLDTLNELAAAINDDASFASTITTQLTGKAKRIDLTNQVQLSSYRKSVIALCDVDNSVISRNSWSGGTIYFHRTNGLHAPVTLQVTMEKRYNATGANYTALVMSGDSFGDNIQYVTFDYNGNTYGGIEFFFSAAEHAQVYFIGESNFDIFGLDYYNTQAPSVLNTEVNNSISTSNMTAETDFFFNNQKIFHSGNDGSTSGLDAQYLNGIPVGSFLRSDAADTASGDITFTGDIIADADILVNSPVNDSAPISVKSLSNNRAIHIEETGTGSESWQLGVDADGNLNFYNSGSSSYAVRFNDNNSATFSSSLQTTQLQTTASQNRTKLRVWSGGTYGMGMHSGFTFGGLGLTGGEYAMTFQMNDDDDRGFWWGDSVHTTAQGAMALTTAGKLTIANALRVGYGQADTTDPTANEFDINGNVTIAKNTTGGQNQIAFKEAGTTRTQITSNYGDNKFYLYHEGDNVMTIDSDSNVVFSEDVTVGDNLVSEGYIYAYSNLITKTNLYLNYDLTNADSYVYFGDSASSTAHHLKFDTSAQQFTFSNRVTGTAGRLSAVEITENSTTSDVDKINFNLNGSTLTITTS